MNKNINMCIVAGTHGDEYEFGSFVQKYVNTEFPNKVTMLKANPLAVIYGQRFVHSDLNRVFDGSGTGYEAERAEQIIEMLNKNQFTHVVDLHTSPTTHSIVPIIPKECDDSNTDQIVNSIPCVSAIVKIPKNLTATSLVGSFGLGGIGLECPRYNQQEFAKVIGEGLVGLLSGKFNLPQPRTIYKVIGQVPQDYNLDGDQIDFTYSEALDGDLFVAAPSIYKGYPGYNSQGMVIDVDYREDI